MRKQMRYVNKRPFFRRPLNPSYCRCHRETVNIRRMTTTTTTTMMMMTVISSMRCEWRKEV
jgi:hypothetical protein